MYLLVFFDPLIVNDSDTLAVKFLFSQKSLEKENTDISKNIATNFFPIEILFNPFNILYHLYNYLVNCNSSTFQFIFSLVCL